MSGRILPWPAVGCDLALDLQNGADGHLAIQRAQPSDAPAGPWGRNESSPGLTLTSSARMAVDCHACGPFGQDCSGAYAPLSKTTSTRAFRQIPLAKPPTRA